MKKFKFLIFIIFINLLSASHSNAYCNFEIVGMGTNINELKTYIPNINLSQASSFPTETKVMAKDICNDSDYENITLIYEYFDQGLASIKFNDYNSSINHLENLKYHYGEPKEQNKVNFGISYYYWDLSFREAFLNIEMNKQGDVLQSSLVITSNNYANKVREYQPND
jgi:hypothetical protein